MKLSLPVLPGDSQNTFVPVAQDHVMALAMFRSKVHQTPEYLEGMYRASALSTPSSGSVPPRPLRAVVNETLQDTAKQRFRYFGSIDGLEPRSGDLPLSQQLVAFVEKDDVPEFNWISQKVQLLEERLFEFHNNNMTDIKGAIEKGRTILTSSGPSDRYAYCLFSLFGPILFEGFKRTNLKKIEHPDESISTIPPNHKLSIDDSPADNLRATDLFGRLLLKQHSRHKYGLDSSHYDQILPFVLVELYNLVGKPVIDRLRQLKVPEQSRIWWCPTCAFCWDGVEWRESGHQN
ncbi:hypothetical protein H4582DRAFT_2060591 [Lactarius indigo]|nr:hypothetical protein H4582DRAFT_2060591 [Lactarius indigo]